MAFDTQTTLKALADPNRLQIVETIAHSEDGVYAQELLKDLDITQPTLSHHMKTLVESGIVNCTEKGRWRRYSLDEENARAFVAELERMLALG